MVLTDTQIEEALTQTADSFHRKYLDQVSKPSSSYRVDAQVWDEQETEAVEGLAFPLLLIREMVRGTKSGPVERALLAFYLAYGFGRDDYRKALTRGGVLTTTDFKSDEIFGITQHETEVIHNKITEIIEDKEDRFVFSLNGTGMVLPWGWAMGKRFKQYVEDTMAMEGIARLMEQ